MILPQTLPSIRVSGTRDHRSHRLIKRVGLCFVDIFRHLRLVYTMGSATQTENMWRFGGGELALITSTDTFTKTANMCIYWRVWPVSSHWKWSECNEKKIDIDQQIWSMVMCMVSADIEWPQFRPIIDGYPCKHLPFWPRRWPITFWCQSICQKCEVIGHTLSNATVSPLLKIINGPSDKDQLYACFDLIWPVTFCVWLEWLTVRSWFFLLFRLRGCIYKCVFLLFRLRDVFIHCNFIV